MKKIFILFLHVCLAAPLGATVGDWHLYPTEESYWRFEQLANRYYLINGSTLVVAEVGHLDEAEPMTRLDGLNGAAVSDIAVNDAQRKLAVVYTDGNIDILDADGNIRNLPDYANYSISADRSIKGIGMSGDTLFVKTGFGAFTVDMRQEVIRQTLLQTNQNDQALLAHCTDVVDAHQNRKELVSVMQGMTSDQGLKVHFATQLIFMHHRLYAMHGIFEDSNGGSYGTPAISILNPETEEWFNLDVDGIDQAAKKIDPYAMFNYLTGIAPDPKNPDRIYACGAKGGSGIFCIENNELKAYYNAYLNPEGMSAQLTDNDRHLSRYTWVGAILMDEDGYVWFTNANRETTTSLRCIDPKGKFHLYSTPKLSGIHNGFDSVFGRLRATTYGGCNFKWVVRTFNINSSAVCIYYDEGHPEDTEKDQQAVFSTLIDQDNNRYNPSYFYDIVEDRQGAMWLLTSMGPFVIDDQIYEFNHPGEVRRIKVPRNDGSNLADYLLNEVHCRCMAVDASNRKWIGTQDAGLYLLSADGLTTLEHFTTDNSPLFSNRIGSLTIDDETGTLYIGTDGGICAYETDVLRDVPDNSELYCYPNPVRPDYSGELSIAGFKNGSTISVTDVNHHVIYQAKSDGAILRWNLEGNDGKRIRPGVYFVEAIEEDGRHGKAFKFLVM